MSRERGVGGARNKLFGGKIKVGTGAKLVIGGRKARVEDDGSYTRYTKPAGDARKAARRKANGRAKTARKANRG